MFQIFQFNPSGNGKHKKLANGEITLGSLIDAGPEQNLKLGNINILLSNFVCEERATFLDYIFGGTEINVHVAIDFTLSNGDPNDPSSLHYIDPHTGKNQYLDALSACMSILENYDDDKNFPVYGFGGKIPGCKQVSHCFALNGNIFDPEVHGV